VLVRRFRRMHLAVGRGLTLPKQPVAQLQRNVFIDRTGVRLLFLHTQFRKHIDDYAGLHLKLPSQLVNSDFLHRKYCFYVIPRSTLSATYGF
jgi:hypothetical protein